MKTSAIAIIAALSLLTGCSNGGEYKKEIEKVNQTLSEHQEEYKFEQTQREVIRFEKSNEIYLGFEKVDDRHGDPLPEKWIKGIQPLNYDEPVSLHDLARAFRLELGVPVHINDIMPTAEFSKSGSVTNSESDGATDTQSDENSGSDLPNSNTAETAGKFISPLPKDRSFRTTGTWKQILDYTAATFKVGYRYKNNALYFDYYETRDFPVHSVAAVIRNGINLGQSAGGSNGTGGAQAATKQITTVAQDIDIWTSIAHGLSARLPKDSRIISRPDTNSITVVSPAYLMPDVQEYFDEQNEILGRQIAWKLEVFSVTLSKQDKSRVGMNLVYRDLEDKFGFNFNAQGTGFGQGASSIASGTILTPPPGSFLQRFEGTNIFAEAFSNLGDTAIVYSNEKTVPNFLPVKFGRQNEIDYVCERRLGTLGDGQQNPVSDAKLCTEPSGFQLNVTANILDDGRVNLQISVSISELIEIESLGDANNFIERPNRNVGDLYHQTFLSSGESVILSGFEQRTQRSKEQDGGQVLCSLFCHNKQYDADVEKLFFIVTPVILAPRQSLQVVSN